jgi:hypothetical protein
MGDRANYWNDFLTECKQKLCFARPGIVTKINKRSNIFLKNVIIVIYRRNRSHRMDTINEEKTALNLKDRIAEIATLEEVSEPEVGRSLDTPLKKGYSIDGEGVLNAYTIEPRMYVDEAEHTGFTVYAEKLNGRLAMIGFVSLLAIEVLTGHGLLWWLTNM